ncbi:MAG: TlpA disulfide reductase family protein [Comamonadaceae bacterium]
MTEIDPGSGFPETHFKHRRRRLLVAVASLATLVGAGFAWRSSRPEAVVHNAVDGLWDLEFATLQGGSMRMATLRGKPLVLNFWATWCPPCIEELPLISSFYQQESAKGWQVLGFAVDQLEPVKRFLARTPVTFPVVMAGMSGVELSRSLGNLSGALPFTVVLGSNGQVSYRKMGKVTTDDMLHWIEVT